MENIIIFIGFNCSYYGGRGRGGTPSNGVLGKAPPAGFRYTKGYGFY